MNINFDKVTINSLQTICVEYILPHPQGVPAWSAHQLGHIFPAVYPSRAGSPLAGSGDGTYNCSYSQSGGSHV